MKKLIPFLMALVLSLPSFAQDDRVKSRDQQLDDYELRLNGWDTRIDSLKKRAIEPKLKRGQRQRLNYKVLDLEKGVEEARREFRAMKGSKDRDWDEHKVALEERLDDIRKSYRSGLAE